MLIALLPDPTAASLEVWSLPLTRRLAGCLKSFANSFLSSATILSPFS